MQELYKIIIKYATEYPILIPFVIFGFFYLKNNDFRKFFNKSAVKIFRISFSNQIFAHDLFFQKNLWLVQIQRVRFDSEAKTKLFRILLSEKVNAVLSVTTASLKENYKYLKNGHPAVVSAILLEIIDKIVAIYEKTILEKYQYEYGKVKGLKLFNIIYVENFKPVHEFNVQGIERKIKRLPFTSGKNIDDVLRSYLSKIQDATDDAVGDCEEAFGNINGGIENIINES
jgi:hypothetical protein